MDATPTDPATTPNEATPASTSVPPCADAPSPTAHAKSGTRRRGEVISVEGLVKRYGETLALDHFDLHVKQGEIFGLLGPNGCGKTTAINCILQLLTYDKGTIRLFGEPMSPVRYDLKRRIGVVPQAVAVFDELTVQENVDCFCALYVPDRARRRGLVDRAIAFVGLDGYRKHRPKRLSGGLLRRLNIACGIAHAPELIFFDEPTVAVDPQSRNAILDGIRQLAADGATVLYTSHYMEEVEQICGRVMIMDAGRQLALGTVNELKAMIDVGEKIVVETRDLSPAALERVQGLPPVVRTRYEEGELYVSCTAGAHNLIDVMTVLQEEGATPGRVYSDPPSLNDVFLALTGKDLRD